MPLCCELSVDVLVLNESIVAVLVEVFVLVEVLFESTTAVLVEVLFESITAVLVEVFVFVDVLFESIVLVKVLFEATVAVLVEVLVELLLLFVALFEAIVAVLFEVFVITLFVALFESTVAVLIEVFVIALFVALFESTAEVVVEETGLDEPSDEVVLPVVTANADVAVMQRTAAEAKSAFLLNISISFDSPRENPRMRRRPKARAIYIGSLGSKIC